MIFEFNNEIDPESASKIENYTIMVGDKKAKIKNIGVGGKKLIITLENDNYQEFRDKCSVNILNIKDINGNILNKRRYLEFYQYRELFVQEYNESISFEDSCFLQQLLLEQNCISKHSGNKKYWMNTPENIGAKK
jgi:hypothetical protein